MYSLENVSMMITYLSILFGLVFAYFYRYHAKRITCRVLKDFNDSYQVVGQKKVKLKDEHFKIGNHQYVIDAEKIVHKFRHGLELNYKFGEARPINFKQYTGKRKSGAILKAVVEDETGSKLFSKYRDKLYLMIIAGLGLGVILLAVYYTYTYNQMNIKILEQSQYIAELLINQTKGGVIVG